MSDQRRDSDRTYGYGDYDQRGTGGHDSQYGYPQYRTPLEGRPTMPLPEVGGYGYSAQTPNRTALYDSQSLTPSSPWSIPPADNKWQSHLSHVQAGVNSPSTDQWQGYDTGGRGLVFVPEEAPFTTSTWQPTHGQPMHVSQTYPYPPRQEHAATMPFPVHHQLSTSPTNNFGGLFHTAEPQSFIPSAVTAHCPPQGHGYPVEMAGGTAQPDYPPPTSNPPMNMSFSGMVATGVAILHHGVEGYYVPVENGDPRAGQSATQSGPERPDPKVKPKPKPRQYTSQQCVPEHEMAPPSRRGTF